MIKLLSVVPSPVEVSNFDLKYFKLQLNKLRDSNSFIPTKSTGLEPIH